MLFMYIIVLYIIVASNELGLGVILSPFSRYKCCRHPWNQETRASKIYF